MFESIKKEIKTKDILNCKGKKAIGEGKYQEDGFVVFKGSKENTSLTPTCNSTITNSRNKLLTDKILIDKNGIFEFQEDYLFSSPSSAASQVLARNANWLD